MDLGNCRVLPERIEAAPLPAAPDAIVARALAPLPRLLAYAHQIAGKDAVCLFLKGQDVGAELTEASRYWQMDVERRASATSPSGAILIIRGLKPAARRGVRA
jgi:16S rRNA (guanine527-N7)-methyltransferase